MFVFRAITVNVGKVADVKNAVSVTAESPPVNIVDAGKSICIDFQQQTQTDRYDTRLNYYIPRINPAGEN